MSQSKILRFATLGPVRELACIVLAGVGVWVMPGHAQAIEYATPVCERTTPCVETAPATAITTLPVQVAFAIYSGLTRSNTWAPPTVTQHGNAFTVSGVYFGEPGCGAFCKPPPLYVTADLPPLPAGHYTIQLFMAPDASVKNPPPVQTDSGPVTAGVTMSGSFDVVPGTDAVGTSVIEYYYPPYDHYFMTANADEIAILDAAQPPFQDWVRTGGWFNAYIPAAAPASTVPICRFYNDSFAPKSSHFFAAHGLGCEETLEYFPDWQLETPDAFSMPLPAADGTCPASSIPVYRVYNNGMGGAPNHRFTTSLTVRQQMMDAGWVAEGNGIGVAMCSPQ